MLSDLKNLKVEFIPQVLPLIYTPLNPLQYLHQMFCLGLNNKEIKYDTQKIVNLPLNADFSFQVRVVSNNKKIKTEHSNTPNSSCGSHDDDFNEDPHKDDDTTETSSPICLKSRAEKCSMTQNYLPLTIQFFGGWLRTLSKTNSTYYTCFILLIEGMCGSLHMTCSEFEDKIYAYLEDKFIGKYKTPKKNSKKKSPKSAQNSEKKKITNKTQMKTAMMPEEKDSQEVIKIKEILCRMLKAFFYWSIYFEYLKTSKASLQGKMFLFVNRDYIKSNMTEVNPSIPKFHKFVAKDELFNGIKKTGKKESFNAGKPTFEKVISAFYIAIFTSYSKTFRGKVKVEEDL